MPKVNSQLQLQNKEAQQVQSYWENNSVFKHNKKSNKFNELKLITPGYQEEVFELENRQNELDLKIQREAELLKYKRESQLMNLNSHLYECGFPVETKFKCKTCIDEGGESLLEVKKKLQGACQIRYCNKPHCITHRYAKTLTALENTHYKTKKGYRKITNETLGLHFSIDYQRCNVDNIKEAKKKLDRQTNSFMSKLRRGSLPNSSGGKRYKIFQKVIVNPHNKKTKKMTYFRYLTGKKDYLYFAPIKMSGVKVFDIKHYPGTNDFLLHYHYCAFPLGEFLDYNILQQVRKDMIANSKSKRKWRLQIHADKERKDGCKKAKSILRYMTKRAIGIYGKSDKYEDKDLTNKKIGDIVKDKGIYLLPQLMSIDKYYDTFYNVKAITYFGNKLKRMYTCNGMLSAMNLQCRFHGFLEPKDIRVERIVILPEIEPPAPPNQSQGYSKATFDTVRPGQPHWKSLGMEELNRLRGLL